MRRTWSAAVVALLSLSLMAAACKEELELLGLPTSESALLLGLCKWLKGPSPGVWDLSGTVKHAAQVATCTDNLLGEGDNGSDLYSRNRANEVLPTGTTVVELFEFDGKTKASKLPRWRADLPLPIGKGNSQAIEAGVVFMGSDFAYPKKTPKKLQVTLYEVNAKGKRAKIAKSTAKVSLGGATTIFGPLPDPAQNYQLEFRLKGGTAEPGSLMFTGGGRYGPTAPASRGAREWRRQRALPSVTSTRLLIIGSHDVEGNVGAGALPKFTADLLPTNTSVSGRRTVGAFITALDEDLAAPGNAPKQLNATLYDVDAKGKRTKVGSDSAALAGGNAQVDFGELPAPSHHYQVEVAASGGGAESGSLTIIAAEAPPTSSRTLLSNVRLPSWGVDLLDRVLDQR